MIETICYDYWIDKDWWFRFYRIQSPDSETNSRHESPWIHSMGKNLWDSIKFMINIKLVCVIKYFIHNVRGFNKFCIQFGVFHVRCNRVAKCFHVRQSIDCSTDSFSNYLIIYIRWTILNGPFTDGQLRYFKLSFSIKVINW